MTEHPFKPGVAVLIEQSNHGTSTWTKGTVAKVHKNGNFTLVGSSLQWRSTGTSNGAYTARRCNREPFDRVTLHEDHPSVRDRAKRDVALVRRERRIRKAAEAIDVLRNGVERDAEQVDKVLDGIEAALAGRAIAQLTDDEKKMVAKWRPTKENTICMCAGDYVCIAHAYRDHRPPDLQHVIGRRSGGCGSARSSRSRR